MIGVTEWSDGLYGGVTLYFKRPVEAGRKIDEPKLVI
jgi:hypothetical protein